jgi:PKD repeat protein
MTNRVLAFAALVAAALVGACTVHQSATPTVAGPSQLALTVTLTATPDRITQDGASQSSIVALAIGPDGQPRTGLPLRLDMQVNGVTQDFGTLSARTIVTGSDGKATSVYTAPPPPPALLGGSGVTMAIFANVIGSDATTTPIYTPPFVALRLVPPGVIIAPADTPTAVFTITPSASNVNINLPATFDGSTSCGGPLQNGACQSVSAITAYAWNFGDGSAVATGKTATHTFTSTGTYNVTLTVTNDRGVQSLPTTQAVTVGATAAPTAVFVTSPSSPTVGQSIVFNGSGSTAVPGRTLTQFNWIFGDGGSATGFLATHTYTVAGTYQVTLSVLDDAGQKGVATQSVTVTVSPGGVAGSPVPHFTSSPTTPVVNEDVVFDSSSSTVAPGRTIVDYAWNFGDLTPIIHGTDRIIDHMFGRADTFVVNLVVTDSAGATGQVTATVVVGTGNPVPLFTVSPTSPTHLIAATFNASATLTFGGATVSSYLWSWGDGSPNTPMGTGQPSTPHTFTLAGTYTVTLTVTDSVGRSGVFSNTVTVQ